MFGHKKKPAVLVVGAGPVGMFAALALARQGVEVEVVDREYRSGTRSYALALHAASLRLLEEAGAIGDVLERAHRVRRIGLYQGSERRAEMRISDLAEDHSFLAVIRQDQLEAALEAQLRAAGVAVHWNHEVTHLRQDPEQATVRIDRLAKDSIGYVVQHTEWVVSRSWEAAYPFVIGADGHASQVRRSLGIESRVVAPPIDFAVFEFRAGGPLDDEMRIVLDDDGTAILWPMPGSYGRWSFQIPQHALEEDTLEKSRDLVMPGEGYDAELTQEHLRELIAQRAPWFTASIEGIRWSSFVRFEGRLADAFGQGRAWLAGDAGHQTGPAGVQSMNVGLREGCDLARRIAAIVGGRAPASTLEDYAAERAAEWHQLLGLGGSLRAGPKTDPWIAARRDRLLPCIPAAGPDLARLAAQLGLRA